MKAVECDYCGLPFKVRRVAPGEKLYCCAGCAVADRVRTGDGEFPVTPELVLALLAGFTAFNQILLLLLSGIVASDGRGELGDRLWWGALAVGVLSWALTTYAQQRSGARRGVDVAIALVGAVLLLIGGTMGSGFCAVAGTLAVLVWSARGWLRPRRGRTGASGLQN
ncbi:hypothetical protein [Actomonas aquatica]|uniref:Uncharacterized protein n=1 Tax=Actomonas aquatica TaxID=2866162 RepID=A0ABZ1CDS7_9BACT|nr:hypothetical protein [Opitutus sp. WL0086]WRQ88440.1 hypothetical protein K1X11_003430 [Opitutus sp. WL0086]